MKTATKSTIALAVATAAIVGLTAPSFAKSRNVHARDAYAMAPGSINQSVTPDGFPIPGYVRATPFECWVDLGYGRWSQCDVGN